MDYDIEYFNKLFKDRKPRPIGRYGEFAVLVPLIYKGGEPHLLFEVRSDNLIKQPGEVCFPGGKVEAGEVPRECALRETMEELNIPIDKIQLITEMDYIFTYSNFTLFSFLGVLEEEDLITSIPNEAEVKDTFTVPFSFFLENEPHKHRMKVLPDSKDFPYHMIGRESDYKWREGASTIDIYNYQGHIIWGLTAKLIRNLVWICKGGC